MLQIYVSLLLIIEALSDQSGFTAFKFQQHGNKIKAERFEIANYDKLYIKYASVVTFKYNRTCTAMNMTFMHGVDMGYDLEIVVQFYKFMSNEYRLFPIRFQIRACDALKENAFGVGKFLSQGNFTGCPLKKNIMYKIWNWTLDESKFPPLIPEGRYMAELQAVYHTLEIGLFRCYLAIM